MVHKIGSSLMKLMCIPDTLGPSKTVLIIEVSLLPSIHRLFANFSSLLCPGFEIDCSHEQGLKLYTIPYTGKFSWSKIFTNCFLSIS